ncbi:MAG: YgjV family protein, partial [Planctomycetes bacterium]|nr:YgjV family protein [Planctomycetota bacterium]
KSDRRLRVCFMFGNSTWLLHNVIAGSPVASVMEASFLASNVFSYYRLYGRKGGEGSLVQAQSE